MGLLDGLMNRDMIFALGLLDAGSPKPVRTNIGAGLLSALGQAQQFEQGQEDRRAAAEDRKQRGLMQSMQMEQMRAQMEAQQQARLEARQAAEARNRYLGSVDPSQGPAMPVSPAAALAHLSPQEIALLAPAAKDKKPHVLKPGEVAFDDSGRQMFSVPDKPEAAPTSVREFGFAQNNPQYAAWLREQANLKAPRAPVVNMYNNDQNKSETDLRKEFADLPQVKRFNSAVPAYKAIEDATKRNTTQADINLVYGIAKLYDPESVVREGEYATIANSQSIPEKIKGFAQYIAGGGRLTPETKAQLLVEARGRIGAFKSEYDSARSTYEGVAKRRNLDPQNIFIGPAQVEAPKFETVDDLASAAAAELRRRRGGN